MSEFDTTNWRSDKILTLPEAEQMAADLHAQGKRLVTVNGSFDLLHAGHLDQLEEAKRQGDILFVGVNSDASVRQGKGENRPLVAEEARAALLAALVCVDYVVVVNEDYSEVPRKLIEVIRPAVHVNGPDYGDPTEWIEWSVMQRHGTRGVVVQRRNDLSTSELIKKIKQL